MGILEFFRQWMSRRDLQTPLQHIKASLEELGKGEILSTHGKELLRTAHQNATRLDTLLTKRKNESGWPFPRPEQAEVTPESKREREVLLLVESNESLHLHEELFKMYEVIPVDNGTRAVEIAGEVNPDIIIAEAVLPGMSGYELCKVLKTSTGTSHIPIILLSALNDKENIIIGLESGANDYIVKPFDTDILKARIRNVLLSREQLHEAVFTESRVTETNYTTAADILFLDRVKQIVDHEMANPEFSVSDLCYTLAMSRTSLYNKLKTLTGQSPNDFIRIIRLNKARELLMSREYTVAEVSDRVGFTDSKYFSTSFKKQFNVSPSKI